MITKLEIKGFKSLVDVSIELGAVNVFIGANGSGKSNLLEAVGFLSAIVSGGLEAELLRYRGVRDGKPSTFCSSFLRDDGQLISLVANSTELSYEVRFCPDLKKSTSWSITHELLTNKKRSEDEIIFSADENSLAVFNPVGSTSCLKLPDQDNWKSLIKVATIFRRLVWEPLQDQLAEMKPRTGSDFEEATTTQLFIDSWDKFAIFTPSTYQLRGSHEDLKREPLGLGGSGLGQAIHEMLKKDPANLGPFDLDDVYELIDWANSLTIDETTSNGEATRLRIGDRFMGNGHKSVSLLEASEGALYVLFLLALVGHEESPKFFAVDNFDQALHPRLARELTERICDQILADGTRQMLATTHNPLVLDGLDLLDDRIRLFTVDRDSKGATQVKRVVVTEDLIEKGFSLSRLWTMGRFGGVPNNL